MSQPRDVSGSSPPVKKKRFTPVVSQPLCEGMQPVRNRAVQLESQFHEIEDMEEDANEGDFFGLSH